MQDSKRGYAVWQFILTAAIATAIAAGATFLMMKEVGLANNATSANVTEPDGSGGRQEPREYDRAAEHLVFAGNFFAEYDNNVVAADEKYKDKYLIIAGNLSEISRDEDGIKLTLLVQPRSAKEIICYLRASEKSSASKLTKGSLVLIKGRCTYHRVKFTNIFKDCNLLKSIGGDGGLVTNKKLMDWTYSTPESKPFDTRN